MNAKLKYVIDFISDDTDSLYIDSAFDFFINNQININELKEILRYKNITLPDSFYSLTKGEQKSYRQRERTIIFYEDNKFVYRYETLFNNPYFYDLALSARRNISKTRKLIEYIKCLGDINLLFLGMRYVKIKNTALDLYSNFYNYPNFKDINNLYDLTIMFLGKEKPKCLTSEIFIQLQNTLKKRLKSDDYFEVDFSNSFVKLCLYIETLLYDLPRKEANTLKIKFGILDKKHLRDIDYCETNKTSKQLLKDYSDIFSPESIKQLRAFSKKDNITFSGDKPNGYLALYNAFLEGD